MADITYDIEALETARKSVEDLITTLNDCKNNLDKDMQELKDGWQTDAGKKFFEEHKDTWSDYVTKYISRITGLRDMLKKAIDYYEKIDDEVANLKV